jgi:adenylate cyclase
MGYETERKFLVAGEFIKEATGKAEIIQGYLLVEPERTIRVRIAGDEAFLTIKTAASPGSFKRGEWEYRIPVTEAMELLPVCLPRKIVKTRYFVPSGRHTFEVDVFHEKLEGLVIAEIELEEESETFIRPGWLGKEVTGDPGYFNSNLIK